MKHTLTAVFDDRGDAQHALNKLLAAGYAREDAVLSFAAPVRQGEHNDSAAGIDEEGKLNGPARHFFSHLLGAQKHGRSDSDSDASPGGGRVLTFTTESETEAQRAAGLVGRLIPADSGENLDRTTWEIPSRPRVVYPQGTEPGTLQNRALGPSHYFGTRSPDNPSLLSDTFRETLFDPIEWVRNGSPTEVSSSNLHALTTATRNDEIAAYQYGNKMHMDEKYRNRSWDEAKDDLKSGWELRDSNAPNWDPLEPAVRRGWDATSPDIGDDSYDRAHWNARYADDPMGKEERALEAVHGGGASHGFQYRMRHWTAAAAALKVDWALRHGGELPPWQRFKDAVLHGWARIDLGNDYSEDASPVRRMGGHGTGVDFADDGPAYRYGAEMRLNDRFLGRSWDDVETELHDGWNSRYGGRGLATWIRNKAEIRHGWDGTK